MIKYNYINSCRFSTTPRVIIRFCRIKVEFVWKSQFLGCWWAFELENCVHIEWTFLLIASFSTKKSTQFLWLFGWWGCYTNVVVTCLTALVQPNHDKPFCIVEIDGNTIIFRFWSDKWRKILNVDQNRKFESALCWLFQNFRWWEMVNF